MLARTGDAVACSTTDADFTMDAPAATADKTARRDAVRDVGRRSVSSPVVVTSETSSLCDGSLRVAGIRVGARETRTHRLSVRALTTFVVVAGFTDMAFERGDD